MKNYMTVKAIALFLAVAAMFCTLWGCNSSVKGLDTNSEEDVNINPVYSLKSAEDIENLVTGDNILVINYYDAYIWAVIFDDAGNIDHMIYIYKFDTPEKAHSMTETRKHELERNKTMKVNTAKSVDNFLLVDLVDSSFEGVKRETLENNFKNLIVY